MSETGREALAIIPARGGSKRLARKNVIDFLGRPIIAYTIEAARESGCFARVVVSTEDAQIAQVARSHGAMVCTRSAALASDAATVVEVCLDVLDREAAAGRSYERFCCLYATAPLRGAADIRAVMDLVVPGAHDFAMAVTTYDLAPYRARRRGADGTLAPLWPDLAGRKAQEMGEILVNNGSTYGAGVAAFRHHRNFHGPGLRGHVMARARSVDIDIAEDLELALWQARRLGLCGA